MPRELNKRWYFHDVTTRLEVNLTPRFGTVGAGLRRDDEDGTLSLQLGFLSVFLSRDAWSYSRPGSLDEWEVSVAVHGGYLWLCGGRMPYARSRTDWPRSYKLPWFEWKKVPRTEKIEHGRHPYTYQWKYQPEVVQNVTAQVSEDVDTWQLRLAGLGLPFFRRQRFLWCDFSEEMGDRRDSWKGGTIGAGFEIRKDEQWQHGYARMQKEKAFCRGD